MSSDAEDRANGPTAEPMPRPAERPDGVAASGDPTAAAPPRVDHADIGPPRRLHPAGIAILAVSALRSAALPLLAIFIAGVAGRGLDTEALARGIALAALAAVAAAVMGFVAWSTTTWRIGPATLHHRRGLLSVKETDVPLARVQALDTVRGPVQRLFGVVGVHVQTAGGGREGEVVLPALSAQDVDALRDAVSGRGRALGAEHAPPAAATLAQRRLDRRGLVVAALTAGQLGVLLPALAAVPQIAENLGDREDLVDAGRFGAGLLPHGVLGWALTAAALLLLAWLLSVLGTVVTFAGFTVRREPDRLRIRRGWIARREASIPVARIQAVRVVEGVLRAPFGLAALRIEVAGYKAEAPAAQTLFPLLSRAEVRTFLDDLLPELADEPGGLTPVPRRAGRRYVLPPTALGVLVGAAAALLIPGAGPWPLIAAAAGAALGVLRYRAAAWRLDGGRLAIRSRRLARVTILAPTSRLQEHGVRQTILQRRGGLADLDVRIGAGTHGRVRHLEEHTARGLFDALRRSAATKAHEPTNHGH
jgi:putative membrane protein